MIQKLRTEWHPDMSFPELIGLCNSLDSMLHHIRVERKIRPPISKCPKCGEIGPQAEPRISVRATILSLGRFQIADDKLAKKLERQWAVYRQEKQLDLYGKPAEARSSPRGCARSAE
jgi:hypothetical protein